MWSRRRHGTLCGPEKTSAVIWMRARHRVSKLLLRQGIIYPGKSWTVVHEQWLQVQRFDAPARQLAFEDAVEAVLLTRPATGPAGRGDRADGR